MSRVNGSRRYASPHRAAFHREWLEMRGYTAGGMPIPQWNVESALRFMDVHKNAAAIFSVSTPGAHFGDSNETRQMARALNIETAQIVAKNPADSAFSQLYVCRRLMAQSMKRSAPSTN